MLSAGQHVPCSTLSPVFWYYYYYWCADRRALSSLTRPLYALIRTRSALDALGARSRYERASIKLAEPRAAGAWQGRGGSFEHF